MMLCFEPQVSASAWLFMGICLLTHQHGVFWFFKNIFYLIKMENCIHYPYVKSSILRRPVLRIPCLCPVQPLKPNNIQFNTGAVWNAVRIIWCVPAADPTILQCVLCSAGSLSPALQVWNLLREKIAPCQSFNWFLNQSLDVRKLTAHFSRQRTWWLSLIQLHISETILS